MPPRGLNSVIVGGKFLQLGGSFAAQFILILGHDLSSVAALQIGVNRRLGV